MCSWGPGGVSGGLHGGSGAGGSCWELRAIRAMGVACHPSGTVSAHCRGGKLPAPQTVHRVSLGAVCLSGQRVRLLNAQQPLHPPAPDPSAVVVSGYKSPLKRPPETLSSEQKSLPRVMSWFRTTSSRAGSSPAPPAPHFPSRIPISCCSQVSLAPAVLGKGLVLLGTPTGATAPGTRQSGGCVSKTRLSASFPRGAGPQSGLRSQELVCAASPEGRTSMA